MSEKKKSKKKKSKTGRIISTVILIAALAVFIYAAYNLITIYTTYKAASDEYDKLSAEYTSDKTDTTPTPTPTESPDKEDEKTGDPYLDEDGTLVEDDVPPLEVDFDGLKAINEDVVGWIYVDAVPEVSFPVVEGTDNDYYLHYTFDRQFNPSAAVFVSYDNARDFSDVHTVIYGHHMHDGSMFFKLDNLRDPDVVLADPYFWIMTPNGNYRYRIFAMVEVDPVGEAYTTFSGYGQEFLEWEEKMKSQSFIDFGDIPLSQYDHCVMLSTCTFDSGVRMVILGKCVSTQRPPDPAGTVGTVEETEENQ